MAEDQRCGMPSAAQGTDACPACGVRGVAVTRQTVAAMLTESAMRRLDARRYRFCPNPVCPTIYFTASTMPSFCRSDVRVPVWQKEPAGVRMICYCFGETEAGIRREIERHGSSGVVERVRGHIAARRCACEIRNPRGVCCLGDVISAVRCAESSRGPAG